MKKLFYNRLNVDQSSNWFKNSHIGLDIYQSKLEVQNVKKTNQKQIQLNCKI